MADGVERPGIWFRTLLAKGSLGPGKIALMRAVGATGSVSAAGRQLRMSHARSVKLVAELNALGARPLIETRAGGDAGGGAVLTPLGCEVLRLYDDLDAALRRAAAERVAAVQKALDAG